MYDEYSLQVKTFLVIQITSSGSEKKIDTCFNCWPYDRKYFHLPNIKKKVKESVHVRDFHRMIIIAVIYLDNPKHEKPGPTLTHFLLHNLNNHPSLSFIQHL